MKYLKFFEELTRSEIIVDYIKGDDINKAIDIVAKQFEDKLSYDESVEYLNEVVNFDISLIAKSGNDILGVLLLGISIIDEIMTYDTWVSLEDVDLTGEGIEGVALVILPQYRGSFVAHQLIIKLKQQDWNFMTIQQYEGMDETMNYFNKTKNIGYFIEDNNRVDIFYTRK